MNELNPNEIIVLVMGGNTIKTWNSSVNCGTMTYGDTSHIDHFISWYPGIGFKEIEKKESTDITDADLDKLADEIVKSQKKKFIIIFGTKKIPYAAEYLKAKNLGKEIFLFGSKSPWVMEEDAKFLLGVVLGLIVNAPQGSVYYINNGTLAITAQ